MKPQRDVVILGGGLAGLTLALQLRRMLPELDVTVLERGAFPVPEKTFKIGESMVEISSWYLREVLGLGDHLLASHLPKFGLRFFMSDGDNGDLGRRPEYGVLNVPDEQRGHGAEPSTPFPGLHLPTYNVDRGRLENHLLQCCRSAGAEVVERCKIWDVRLGDPHEITTDDGSSLSARWVIDSTGRAGFLARRLKLRRAQTHEVNAIWFRLDGRIDPDLWTADSAYHGRTRPQLRWLSTNHLMGPGYWIWLIPLPDGATSVGIMADPDRHPFERLHLFDRALTWLGAREPQLAAVVSSLELLDFRAMKARSYHSLRSLSPDRWALCGESAFFVDALYSPGGDFIAVGNTLITQMIAADVRADRLQLSILSKFGEQLLSGMFRHYLGLYRGSYELMGCPRVMLQKVAWDTAVYFGYNVFLFCNDRLCDYEFHRTVREENMRLESLQQRMMYRLKQQAPCEGSYSGRFIDQARVEPVQTLYRSSDDRLTDPVAVKDRLRLNMDVLERFSSGIEELVA